ncbi:MAG TPA: hypothetical protein VI792_08435, partial [Candidatus Eisenbacteria bacterium]
HGIRADLGRLGGRRRGLVRRAALDLEYVERRSPWLDLVILARTVGFVLGPHPAARGGASSTLTVAPPHGRAAPAAGDAARRGEPRPPRSAGR